MANTHHEVANSPVKEISFALIGIVLFLAMVLWIGIAAYLRPAGEHHTAESLSVQTADVKPIVSAAIGTDDSSDTATHASEVASEAAVAARQDVNAEASAHLDNATIVDEENANTITDSTEVDSAMSGNAQAGIVVVPTDAPADTAEAPASQE